MSMPNPFGLPELFSVMATDASGNPIVFAYVNGHMAVRGIFGGGTAPTLAAGAGAGAGASVGSQKGFDIGGSFVVTTAGTPAAGVLATVTFGTALNAAPASVIVSALDTTANTVLAAAPGLLATTGFSVYSAAATTAHTILVNYQVMLAQQ